ncbi:MAG: inositol monophosphatase family protein [Desulfobaccales bacterium]
MNDSFLKVARQAAVAAGALLRLNFDRPHDITLKGVIDPVTESDLQSQEIIISLIRQAFPDHAILAEEDLPGSGDDDNAADPEGKGAASHRWIIDPLDGTVNYAHGFPMFCVSVACEVAGRLEVGVIYDPLREELFEARRGGGAWLNGRRLRVSATDLLEAALLVTGFPYNIRERLPATVARLRNMIARAQGVRRAGSAALDLAYVAAGRFDGFWEEGLKPWDTAAGVLLVTEAGGRLSTFEGGAYDIFAPSIVATNGRVHEAMLAALKIEPEAAGL